MLIQMPFLYALYYSIYTVLRIPNPLPKNCAGLVGHAVQACLINLDIYPFLPHFLASTVPQTWFIWTDLATPDRLHILPVLAGVLTFLQLRMAMPVKKPKRAWGCSGPDGSGDELDAVHHAVYHLLHRVELPRRAGALLVLLDRIFRRAAVFPQRAHLRFALRRNPWHGASRAAAQGADNDHPAPATPARGGARSAAAIAPSVPEGPPPGGFRALVQQMRQLKDSMSAGTHSQAATAGTNGAQGTNANPVERPERPAKPASASGGSPYPPRRAASHSREREAGPPQPSQSSLGSSAGTKGESRPEDEIRRAGKSSLNGKTMLPEQAIAQDNAGSNGVAANGTLGAGSNGTNGVNGKSR